MTIPYMLMDTVADIRKLEDGTFERAQFTAAIEPVHEALKRAAKIVLDDETTAVAARLSTGAPQFLLKCLPVARPPYDVLWIEWNEAVRYASLTLGTGRRRDLAERAGVLIAPITYAERQLPHVTSFWGNRLSSAISSTGFAFDPDNDQLLVSALADRATAIINEDRDMPTATAGAIRNLMGPSYVDAYPDAHLIAHHGCICMGLGLGPYIALALKDSNPVIRGIAKQHVSMSLTDTQGTYRYLLAVFTLLNTVETTAREVKYTRQHQQLRRARKMLPSYEYKVLAIKVPAKRSIEQEVRAAIAKRASPRLHEVRGHWCHSHKNPEKRWWRRHHVKGDEKRGVVEKTYETHVDHSEPAS